MEGCSGWVKAGQQTDFAVTNYVNSNRKTMSEEEGMRRTKEAENRGMVKEGGPRVYSRCCDMFVMFQHRAVLC